MRVVHARERMEAQLRDAIRAKIGGEQQDIESVRAVYRDQRWKQILLPMWISAFAYRGKVYRFVVNGRSGVVHGERPWSYIKIALFASVCVAVFVGLLMLAVR